MGSYKVNHMIFDFDIFPNLDSLMKQTCFQAYKPFLLACSPVTTKEKQIKSEMK